MYVEGTIFPCVSCDQSLDSFDTYFSSTIAVRECYRTEAMVYPTILQELPGCVGYEFRATIRREFVWYPIGGKGASKDSD